MGGVFWRNGVAFQPDGAAIGVINAGQGFNQRRFSRAVFPSSAMISPRRRLKSTLSSAFTPGRIYLILLCGGFPGVVQWSWFPPHPALSP
jgi:hypothetical protein